MTTLFDLAGKVALVTGCNKGLGQGMALALAKAGADIIGFNREDASETAEKVAALGRKFVNFEVDVSDAQSLPGLVKQAAQAFGKLDILVNNAGIIRRTDAIDYSLGDWQDVIDINLTSVFVLSQAVAQQFVAQGTGGKIINIASMLSFQGGIRVPAYTASKSAVMGLTRALANEWASKGINVNAIAPGYMATDNTAALRADVERNQAILERIPAARWGTPDDLGGPVVFLSSAAADYVNGYTLAVDGGWLAR
ncbi:2-dehydro-3-deoxy-D-gluconate 5-dehydrogenase KduD [Psittacicella hinzii]|nr:2-dehydro-3-deoxy-D-gluconate 5-dehydrogenase KduD [Psittacicella hinzii]